MVPCIRLGWMLQKYWYSPGALNVATNVWPGVIVVDWNGDCSGGTGLASVPAVIVCRDDPLFCHVTASPTFTLLIDGVKENSVVSMTGPVLTGAGVLELVEELSVDSLDDDESLLLLHPINASGAASAASATQAVLRASLIPSPPAVDCDGEPYPPVPSTWVPPGAAIVVAEALLVGGGVVGVSGPSGLM
jgi:hypothetical protein